jgi:type II secretory pathway component PulJ
MLPALLWIIFASLIGLLAWRWFRSMSSDMGRILVMLVALAALVYTTYRIAQHYPADSGPDANPAGLRLHKG